MIHILHKMLAADRGYILAIIKSLAREFVLRLKVKGCGIYEKTYMGEVKKYVNWIDIIKRFI